MTTTLRIRRPDDWHLHLRDGASLEAVLPATARAFQRAIVMPNLKPPVRTTQQAMHYRERILGALPEGSDFEPFCDLGIPYVFFWTPDDKCYHETCDVPDRIVTFSTNAPVRDEEVGAVLESVLEANSLVLVQKGPVAQVLKPSSATGAPATKVTRLAGRARPASKTNFGKNLTALLSSGQGVAMAVVLQEILGPPKSKRG